MKKCEKFLVYWDSVIGEKLIFKNANTLSLQLKG